MRILFENMQYGFIGAVGILLLMLPVYEESIRREKHLWGFRAGFWLRTTIFVVAGLVLLFRAVSREWWNHSWSEPAFAYVTIGCGAVLGLCAVRFLAWIVRRTVECTAADETLVGR